MAFSYEDILQGLTNINISYNSFQVVYALKYLFTKIFLPKICLNMQGMFGGKKNLKTKSTHVIVGVVYICTECISAKKTER